MVARRGLGLITSSSFFVPQVNLPGSMATFVTRAVAMVPFTSAALAANGGRSTRSIVAIVPAITRKRRGIGQDSTDTSTIDFGTAPAIDTSSTTSAVDWSTVLAGASSGPSYPTVTIPSLPSPGYISSPAMTTADIMARAGPQATVAAAGTGPWAAQPTSTNWLSSLLGGTSYKMPATQSSSGININVGSGASGGTTANPLASLTSSSMMPVLLLGVGLLVMVMMAKK